MSTKLVNPSTSSKTYWLILKNFANGKKIPIIPPILLNDKFVTNFLKETNLFNEFFSKRCELLKNNSTLPKSNTYHAENSLNDITFDNEKPLKIIQSCKKRSWIRWYFNQNAKAKQFIHHNKTTFYCISELPEIWCFPRWLEKRKHCTSS